MYLYDTILIAKKMPKKLIHLKIDDEIFRSANKLLEMALEDDDFTFFRLRTKSQNSWYEYLIEMGIMATKKEFDNFRRRSSDET